MRVLSCKAVRELSFVSCGVGILRCLRYYDNRFLHTISLVFFAYRFFSFFNLNTIIGPERIGTKAGLFANHVLPVSNARAHSSLAPARKTSCNLSSNEIPSARCIAR